MLKKFLPRFLLIAIILVAILPRFIFLNNVPVAVNTDEMHYVLNAKSFFITGKDISGKITPLDILLFNYPKYEMPQAELTYFLQMPIFGLFNFSLANTVLPNALLGILTASLIYLITKKLFDQKTALVASLLTLINPWLIFVGRTSYESGLATCLFILLFYLFLIAKGWKILLIFPIALLAFYSYIGTKFIFILFISFSIIYSYFFVAHKKYLKQYLILFMLCLVLVLFFLSQVTKESGARTENILLPNSPYIVSQVNYLKATTLQNPLMNFSENKYYVYLTVLTSNAFKAISPYYLFAGGDYFYMIGIHGIFYYVDIIFLFFGLLMMFMEKRKNFLILSLLAGLSLLPQIFYRPSSDGNFTPHIALMVPFLVIFISFGIYKTIGYFKNNILRRLFIVGLIIVYGFLFVSFLNVYFFRFPLQDGTFAIKNRILSKYLTLAISYKKDVIVHSQNPESDFKEFLFYSNVYDRNNVVFINEKLRKHKYVYKNTSFVGCSEENSKNSTVINELGCGNKSEEKPLNIVQVKDNGSMYAIFNDSVCSRYQLPRYTSNLKLSDFNIEQLSQRKFCETFIVSY